MARSLLVVPAAEDVGLARTSWGCSAPLTGGASRSLTDAARLRLAVSREAGNHSLVRTSGGTSIA